jgi:hypothetical protein
MVPTTYKKGWKKVKLQNVLPAFIEADSAPIYLIYNVQLQKQQVLSRKSLIKFCCLWVARIGIGLKNLLSLDGVDVQLQYVIFVVDNIACSWGPFFGHFILVQK